MNEKLVTIYAITFSMLISTPVLSEVDDEMYDTSFENYQEIYDSPPITVFGETVHYAEHTCLGNVYCSTGGYASCPGNKHLTSIKVACNLEWGYVSDSELNSVPNNTMKIVREEDNRHGVCRVENINGWDARVRGQASTAFLMNNNAHGFFIRCHENDSNNGGECHVRTRFTCI